MTEPKCSIQYTVDNSIQHKFKTSTILWKSDVLKISGVTETVTRHIRNLIILRELPPGMRLNETELSKSLGVSRPPLREAFRILENEKLVVNVPRIGTYVSEMSDEDFEQLFRVRTVLECAAVDIIIDQGIEDLSPLKDAIQQEKTLSIPISMTSTEMSEYFSVMASFHLNLIAVCGNDWLRHFYEIIKSSLARYQIMYLKIPGSRDSSISDHEDFLEMVKKGLCEDAKRLLGAHIARVADSIREDMNQTANNM